jgi:hypothetical protein
MNYPTLLHWCAKLCALSFFIQPASAQVDNFDSGALGWTQFAPLAPFGGTSIAATGGTYNMACQPSPSAGMYGPSRAGSLRLDRSYSSFCVMVDIVNWNPAEDSSLGILARIQPNPGAGALSGYAFTWQSEDNDVQISRVTNEQPADLSGNPRVTLTPGGSYRMVFTGIGNQLEGRIYDLANLATPLITATANDNTYTAGTCGLLVFSDENTRCSGSFDNYFANDGTPPPLQISRAANGNIQVSWDAMLGLGATLEFGTDLSTWWPSVGGTFTVEGGRVIYTDVSAVEFFKGFYRLHTGPALFPA